MLAAINLQCIRGTRTLFSKVNFALEAGGMLQVEGVNGSGKTSLLRMVSGLTQPAEGEIHWRGQGIRQDSEQYFGEMTYLGHSSGVKDELTALENLRISAQLAGDEISEEGAWSALQQLGLEGRENLPTKVLSAGQRRRVALARLLLTKKPLWLLDEPLTSLDVAAISLLEGVLAAHVARGGMVMLTTHQPIRTPSGTIQRLQLNG